MNLASSFKSLPLSVSPLKMSNQSGHIIPGDVPAVAFAKVSSTGSWSTGRNLFQVYGGGAELYPGHHPFPVPHGADVHPGISSSAPLCPPRVSGWGRTQFVGGVPPVLGFALWHFNSELFLQFWRSFLFVISLCSSVLSVIVFVHLYFRPRVFSEFCLFWMCLIHLFLYQVVSVLLLQSHLLLVYFTVFALLFTLSCDPVFLHYELLEEGGDCAVVIDTLFWIFPLF